VWHHYCTLLAQEGGKQHARPLLCQSRAAVSAVSDTTYQISTRSASWVWDEECFSTPHCSEKGEVWPENYVDGEEPAGRGGTDLNGISCVTGTALTSADLVEAK